MSTHEKISSMNHITAAMNAGQVIKLSKAEVDLIVDIYKNIAPGRRLNAACASCLQMAIAYIATWLEQNHEPLKDVTQKKKMKKDGLQ
jgi:hypothetical protein